MAEEAPPTPEGAPAPATDWEARHKEAQVKISQQGEELAKLRAAAPPPATPATPTPPATGLAIPDQAAASGVIARAGLTMQQLGEQIRANNGRLPEETYAKLEQQGASRAETDLHIQGLQAIAELEGQRIETAKTASAQHVGGQAQLDNLIAWSASITDPTIRDDLNRRLGAADTMVGAVADLHRRHQQATGGADTQPLAAGGPAPSQAAAFSADEWGEVIRKQLQGGKLTPAEEARMAATPAEVIQSRSM